MRSEPPHRVFERERRLIFTTCVAPGPSQGPATHGAEIPYLPGRNGHGAQNNAIQGDGGDNRQRFMETTTEAANDAPTRVEIRLERSMDSEAWIHVQRRTRTTDF